MTDEASVGATTGSAVAQQRERPSGNRLERLGYNFKKPAVLKELAPKHRLLIDYIVNGCPHESAANLIGRNAGEPLELIEAADLLHIKRRNARQLAKEPVFQRALAAELQSFREGHKAEALREVVRVMRADGQGKAADRKVKLTAASMLLGDAIAQQGQTNVSVQVGVGVAVQTPGYVIDLSGAQADQPTNQQTGRQPRGPAATTIDLTAEQSDDDAGGL